jgi:hypothetical protein
MMQSIGGPVQISRHEDRRPDATATRGEDTIRNFTHAKAVAAS